MPIRETSSQAKAFKQSVVSTNEQRSWEMAARGAFRLVLTCPAMRLCEIDGLLWPTS
jgi:hypothetical protein